jgi:preprotein translocase subunit SecG
MNILFNIVLLLHVVAAIGIIVLVLIQHGKGADMGAAFGSGSAGSLFGASGSANFLSRTTGVLATVFFLTSLSMAYLATHRTAASGGVMDSVTNTAPAPRPATPPAPAGAASPAAIPGPAQGQAAPAAAPAPAPAVPAGEAPKSTQIPK